MPIVADAIKTLGISTDEAAPLVWEPPADHVLYPRFRRLQEAAHKRAAIEMLTLPQI